MSRSWKQVRTYADHLGHPVVLEQYVNPEYEPEPSELVAFQVYSLVPLDDDHDKLRDYLMQIFWNNEVKPLFEIYSYRPPDGFACIEHNRIEIARRKQQHQSGVKNPLPLIPRFNRPYSSSNVGFCVLIRSHSYRVGNMQDSEEAEEIGEGPDLLYFNRTFSSTSTKVDVAQNLREGQEELPAEAFEFVIERLMDQIYTGQLMVLDIFNNVPRYPERDALGINEGEPPSQDMPTEEQIRDQLDQETSSGFSLDPAFHISQEANIVTVTNTPKGKSPDIQYIVHAAFLSHIRDTEGSSILESTALLFTASMVSNLPANKTLTLKFFIPKSNSWSAIRPAQNEVLEILSQRNEENRENPFSIGALHNITTYDGQPLAAKRVTPQGPDQYIKSSQGACDDSGFRTFTVVLDRAKFVSEAGVYFYMTDSDESEEPDTSSDDTIVSRVVDMNTAAWRLGVVVLDE
ncbi:hypothetical protein PCG10_009823 [Penicillium crustosum]|uniref:Uncharacterized protein n=1 Tax=Penicillium crustosum TaxID=36656 RepID=A0A9P5GFH4_PENCR|nr:uncharacterized protein N7487_004464 [Penicillium crustosum]KAF7519657.1 hypothetical protein PCG10_009823 [Penicillium crustosum]KAJ5410105.1 hypothetical protein N7487_004464 [Penicillium crustosum]